MRPFLAALFLLATPLAATAQSFDFCEELWVTRNMIFDRAGYCFGSTLGQSLFDNSNCTTGTANAPQAYAQIIAWARGDEERLGCRVNTAQPAWPSIRSVYDYYNQYWTVAVPVDGGFGCWGYSGPTVTVYAGAASNTPVLGQLTAGQSYSTTHYGVDGWEFISVSSGPGGQTFVTGWARGHTSDCAQMAG